jgi:uncharacterized membrane protein YfcA
MDTPTLSALFGQSFSASDALLAIAIAAAAGVVRGVTGFGAAMVMAPPLAMLLGPALAVPIVLLLEAFAAAPMLPQASRLARWNVLGPILGGAALCVPLGTALLTTQDPQVTRRAIAFVVLGFGVVLLAGLRWSGRHRPATGFALGGFGGAMLGATSIGGPPVILYLLAGPDDAATTRATLTLYVALSASLGLAALAWRGAIPLAAGGLGLAMAPLFMLGVVFGGRVFARLSEQRFRRVTIWLMLAVSAWVLVA